VRIVTRKLLLGERMRPLTLLSPLPESFPCLDQSLDGAGAWESTFLQAAGTVGIAVEILDVLRAEERQAPLELFQLFLGQNVVSLYVRAPYHGPKIYHFRFLFASMIN
jgi:hypothetical protein